MLALLLVGGLAGLLLLFWPRTTSLPADVVLPSAPHKTGPLRITFFGTSLTASYDWPEQIGDRLISCLDHHPQITLVARPGAGSDWALTQVAEVAAARPDILLIEFSINDADLRGGQSLSASIATHRRLITALRAALPQTKIVLMTMSPASGLRGWMRPRLSAYYAMYHDLAAEANLGLIDLYPRWLALPPGQRGLDRDGLHPDPAVAANVIVPLVAAYVARAVAGTCFTP